MTNITAELGIEVLDEDDGVDSHGIGRGGQMSLNLAVPFDQRSGCATIPFSGLAQNGKEHCVYGSVAGAVNHLAGIVVWATAKHLADECDRVKKSNPTFDVWRRSLSIP